MTEGHVLEASLLAEIGRRTKEISETQHELARQQRVLSRAATLLRLAYNGFPRVIPIGFYWNGNQIVVCTAATAPNVSEHRDDDRCPRHAYEGEGAPGARARKRGH